MPFGEMRSMRLTLNEPRKCGGYVSCKLIKTTNRKCYLERKKERIPVQDHSILSVITFTLLGLIVEIHRIEYICTIHSYIYWTIQA